MRLPSGVTTIKQRPVSSVWQVTPGKNFTPTFARSLAKDSPKRSAEILPMKPALPPRLANPYAVLAALPPLISVRELTNECKCLDRDISTKFIEPLTIFSRTKNPSSTVANTSTRALPIVSESRLTPVAPVRFIGGTRYLIRARSGFEFAFGKTLLQLALQELASGIARQWLGHHHDVNRNLVSSSFALKKLP